MNMELKKEIIYFGQKTIVSCDGNCKKAWGRNSRPATTLPDDFNVYLSDDELGDAPDDPGTYEGGDAKPLSNKEFPNKWCVRECERCDLFDPGEKITVKIFSAS